MTVNISSTRWCLISGEEYRCHMEIGLWVLTGLFCFLIIEKIFPDEHSEDEDGDEDKHAIKVGRQ